MKNDDDNTFIDYQKEFGIQKSLQNIKQGRHNFGEERDSSSLDSNSI